MIAPEGPEAGRWTSHPAALGQAFLPASREFRMINLADLVTKDRVLLDLRSGSKRQLLQALADAAAQATGVESATILEALVQREKLGTTGLGEGIAIPHAKIPALAELTGFFVRLDKPVDFDALDGHPVDLVFLLLAAGGRRRGPSEGPGPGCPHPARSGSAPSDREAATATEVSSLLSGRGDGSTA